MLFRSLPGEHTPVLDPTTYGLGFGYSDECTTLKVDFSSSYSQPVALTPVTRDETILVQLTLRTLGEVKVNSDVTGLLGGTPPPD